MRPRKNSLRIAILFVSRVLGLMLNEKEGKLGD